MDNRNLIKHIQANLSEPDLKVNDLAKDAGMSRTLFFKEVKDLMGKTPHQLIKDIRLNQATCLLAHDNLSVWEITYQVGFASPKYFRKCFKKQFGVTPTAYRKEHLSIDNEKIK